MWEAVQHVPDSGEWRKLGTFETLDDCKLNVSVSSEEKEHLFYFYAEQPPSDHAEAQKIVEQAIEANDGRITMATIGMDFSQVAKNPSITTCPGRCFCVIARGRRRCETYYCNNHWCWWVPCGMSC